MKNIFAIAIDTSGRIGSVAAGTAEKCAEQIYFSDQIRHAAELFPTIIELTKKQGKTPQDITEVYVTAGPGSFTGLRIAITAAKMMALASDVRICAISSLDCAAKNAFDYIPENSLNDIEVAVPIIDAKRGQFFAAVYEKKGGGWIKCSDELMEKPEKILEKISEKTAMLTGEGLKFYKDKFALPDISFTPEDYWGIRAEKVYEQGFKKARQGEFEDPQTLLPKYIRLSDAEENLLKKGN